METLKWLVNNITMDLDFKSVRDAFRLIDTANSGRITIEEVKKGFRFDSHVNRIFMPDKLIE
jgi:calcium-dependent protein kinase